MAFLGRTHPLLIHFPIALVIAAVAAEAVATAIRDSPLKAAESVHEVQVVATKFAFEPGVIRVTAGERVRLVIRADDTVHGFAIRGLNIDVQIPRGGETVTTEFTAPAAGRYEIACSEFCGIGHAQMKAALVAVAPARTGS